MLVLGISKQEDACEAMKDDVDGENLVFLSPNESPPKKPGEDQGPSLTLRRSNRKRKLVTAHA